MLRWVRSRNVYRPRTGGDRRDRWRMLMKRLLLYTTTGCGGSSERLATSNPPSYRVIFLLDTNPNCSVTSVLFDSAVMLETQSMHAVVSNLVKQYRYCSQVLPVHVQ